MGTVWELGKFLDYLLAWYSLVQFENCFPRKFMDSNFGITSTTTSAPYPRLDMQVAMPLLLGNWVVLQRMIYMYCKEGNVTGANIDI